MAQPASWSWVSIFALLLNSFVLANCMFEGNLNDRFDYFEKLDSSVVTHHVDKRAIDDSSPHEKVISIDALGKHFRLHLQSATDLFARDFVAIAVSSDHTEKEIPIDRREFFAGYVEGMAGSTVNAHWQGDTISAVIHTEEDTFVIEPSRGHIKDADKFSMIAYRFSDMKRKVESDLGDHFCGLVDKNGTDHAPYIPPQQDHPGNNFRESHKKVPLEEVKHRYRRQDNKLTRCGVSLVADHTTFQNIGGYRVDTTVKYMATVMSEVNKIFRETKFGDGNEYAMEIQEIIIHVDPGDDSSHYNFQRSSAWDTNELLTAFSSVPWDHVCLAHLFTYQPFNNGVLGLAWVAGEAKNSIGGICTSKSGVGKYYNTGWSSSESSSGNRLTTVEAYLVTAHEFGHNWGSPHDPGSCAPSSGNGGKYLMYMYAVNGNDNNNFKFSSCSRSTIQNVLNVHKDRCFVRVGETANCGDYIKEGDEQCDPGFDFGVDDPCCNNDCSLKPGKVCSDKNDACCIDCAYAPATFICNDVSGLTGSCALDVSCTGTTKDCPVPAEGTNNQPSGTQCSSTGQCTEAGICESACERNGQQDCLCENDANSCKVCCRDNEEGDCGAYTGGDISSTDLTDGTPCFKGYCDDGECKSDIRDLNKRLWDILDDVEDFSGFVKFMRNNIVLSIVVLSLIIYLPFVIIVLILDCRWDKEDDDAVDWGHKDNDALFAPSDRREVRDTYTRSRRPRTGYVNPAYSESDAGSRSHASASGINFGNSDN